MRRASGACWRPYGAASPFNQALEPNPPVAPDSGAISSPSRRSAQATDAPYYASCDSYVLNLAGGVDWARYLQVLAPCVTSRTC
jgi:hypothetical protein